MCYVILDQGNITWELRLLLHEANLFIEYETQAEGKKKHELRNSVNTHSDNHSVTWSTHNHMFN